MMDDISDKSSEENYIEDEEEMFNIKCLFCDYHSCSHEMIFDHFKNEHRIRLIEACKQNHFDTFQYIKLINYIRKNNVDMASFDQVIANKLFDCDEFLKPTMEDDHLLMFDYESEIEVTDNNGHIDLLNVLDATENEIKEFYQNSSKEKMIQDIIDLTKQVNDSRNCLKQLKKMIVGEKDEIETENNSVTTLPLESDTDYIESYSHFSIHHTMLADKPRTLAYQDAILENGSFFKDKTVLDIGCGSGILSLFAAKAGAKLVVAVDQSDIIYNAQAIIHENGFKEKIKFIKNKLEIIDFGNLNLPTKYDIIISEWMGYFLLFEGMLETVLYARENLLQNDGAILPNRYKLFLSAFSDCTFYEKYIDFWNDVYGFKMSSMIDDVTREVCIDSVNPENVCATTEKICDFNILSCPTDFTRGISSMFELKFKNDSTIHGFVGWFDCYFESMSKLIILSTSPFSESTHWKQTILPLKEPILVKSGQVITGQITIQKNKINPRSLQIMITLKEENLKFTYNIY